MAQSSAGNVFSGCFWFVVTIVTATFAANLIATLATQKPPLPYKNLQDLVDDESITLLIRHSTSPYIVLKVTHL